MSSIKTYEDLELEKQRLISILKNHEASIKTDVAGVRHGLQPVNKAFRVINKMATRDNTGPMLNLGLEMGIDLLVRKAILARAGWFAKVVVPYLLKNYSSHILGEEKREALLNKLRGLFSKLRPKPDDTPEDYTQQATHV